MSNKEIIRTENVLVRVMELDNDASSKWHYHSEVTDYFVCLNGAIRIETKSPESEAILKEGQRTEVKPPQIHRVVNIHEGNSKYLLVQGIGTYDFNKVGETYSSFQKD